MLASISLKAEAIGPEWFTNSTLFSIAVVAALVIVVQVGVRKLSLVPSNGMQNFFEWVVESLYATFEGVVGKHMIRATFPLLGSIFIFILVANWSALLPGVGTIGFGEQSEGHFHVTLPLLRPSNADLNTPLAITLLFMLCWLYWTIRELGVVGFLLHLFGPKGGLKGTLKILLLPIFFAVGVIEVVSILLRNISLPIRLFGNVFAGENLLHAMGGVAGEYLSVLVSLPFYGLEILIGLLQALVFTLLCAVYIKLSTTHEDEDH